MLTSDGRVQIASDHLLFRGKLSSGQILGWVIGMIILALLLSVRFGILSEARPPQASAALPLSAHTYAVWRTSQDYARANHPELRSVSFPAYNCWDIEEVAPGLYSASCFVPCDTPEGACRTFQYVCLVRQADHGWRSDGSSLR
ncbi:MAG: hypothetical protein IT209_09110 [Armatimonadetes bacterium]|nr:hypothetical protein [Armatimonadota bacterium]